QGFLSKPASPFAPPDLWSCTSSPIGAPGRVGRRAALAHRPAAPWCPSALGRGLCTWSVKVGARQSPNATKNKGGEGQSSRFEEIHHQVMRTTIPFDHSPSAIGSILPGLFREAQGQNTPGRFQSKLPERAR